MTQASDWLEAVDDNALTPITALGKALDVTSRFSPMTAACEHRLQYLEEGLASSDRLYMQGVCNV